jgi:hypothetical protein
MAARIERQPQTMAVLGNELTDLIRCLKGAQANDSGWAVFKGKYVEYPPIQEGMVGIQEDISWTRKG